VTGVTREIVTEEEARRDHGSQACATAAAEDVDERSDIGVSHAKEKS
jgi:hypothetical protein